MQRYFIKLSYNGTRYHGWQLQKNTPLTIQQVLNERLSKILAEKIETTGCGRTDTGVHATCYYAHFDSKHTDLHLSKNNWVHKFNSFLPHDIVVNELLKVSVNANARFDAIERTYQYWITSNRDPFVLSSSHYFYNKVDIDLMQEACDVLMKHTDFGCFCKTRATSKTNICHIKNARWYHTETFFNAPPSITNSFLVFEIKADRFLRNMVRAIVGTMLDVGQKKIALNDFKKILKSNKRAEAGVSVPAQGLYLTQVTYSKDIFIK